MITVYWPTGVNTKVLKESTWDETIASISDETRCGVKKVRASETFAPITYNIKMRFTKTEYDTFREWFVANRRGILPFYFPDVEGTGVTKTYRFASGSKINYSNVSGKLIDVSMTFEEV